MLSHFYTFIHFYSLLFTCILSHSYTLTNFMPPADTAALICLSFTNACVVSTIIIFRCGRMAPPHSERLGLKHVIVHFRNEFTQ